MPIPIKLTNHSKHTTLHVNESRGDDIGIVVGTTVRPGQTVEIGQWEPDDMYSWGWIFLGRNRQANDYQVYFYRETFDTWSYSQSFGRYSRDSSQDTPNPSPLPGGIARAHHDSGDPGAYHYFWDDTVVHQCRLTAGTPDFWQHSLNGGASWGNLRMSGLAALCDLPIHDVAAHVTLKVNNNCRRPFRLNVYDAAGAVVKPEFGQIDLQPTQWGDFEFPVEGITELHYKTQGPYLDGAGEQVPDPKFTIKRQG